MTIQQETTGRKRWEQKNREKEEIKQKSQEKLGQNMVAVINGHNLMTD